MRQAKGTEYHFRERTAAGCPVVVIIVKLLTASMSMAEQLEVPSLGPVAWEELDEEVLKTYLEIPDVADMWEFTIRVSGAYV